MKQLKLFFKAWFFILVAGVTIGLIYFLAVFGGAFLLVMCVIFLVWEFCREPEDKGPKPPITGG